MKQGTLSWPSIAFGTNRLEPRLADSLVPAKGWELAVETVLGSYLQAIAVDDVVASIDLLDDFKKGELLLISKGEAAKNSADKVSSVLEHEQAQHLCYHVSPLHQS